MSLRTFTTQPNWNIHDPINHWLKHSILPVVFIVACLFLPKPWNLTASTTDKTIEIDLVKEPTPEPINPAVKEPEPSKPELQPKVEIESKPKPNPAPKTSSKPPKSKSSEPVLSAAKLSVPKAASQPEINASDVLKMLNNRQSIEIPTEFQARTEPVKDFYIPEPEIEDWLADIPFLDESVEKHRLKLYFYPEGIEGSIEKFFDKITIKKTFTTKYGTKIHCALIGVIAACSWK